MSPKFGGAGALLAAVLLTAPLCAQSVEKLDPSVALVQKAYSVADLVVPMSDLEVPPFPKPSIVPKTKHDQLVELITTSVDWNSWARWGGCGTIDYFPLTMSLVIKQSPAVHERIADLLSALRKAQDTQVVLEVRLITVSEDCYERIGVDFNAGADRTEKDPMFLNDTQVSSFLEAVQGDRHVNVLQAPKMTLLNGQTATLNLTDTRYFVTSVEKIQRNGETHYCPRNEPTTTGLKMTAKPVVSADGTRVQLNLKMDWTQLASETIPLMPITSTIKGSDNSTVPFTQFVQQPKFNTVAFERNVVIPDGGTLLLGRFRQEREARQEYGPPVLSKIPYVNRLFKNVGYGREGQSVCVLVTPRIVEAEEEKPCSTGVIATIPAPTSEAAPCASTRASEGSAHALAILLNEYKQACAEGRDSEAAKLAQAALAIDPRCFHHKR